MTEKDNGLPPEQNNKPFPEGFETPTDSVLLAEASRDYYESLFVYNMTRTSAMPETLYTPSQKTAVIQARISSIKLILESRYNIQDVLDDIDISSLSKDNILEATEFFGLIENQKPVEEYQMENYLRTGANIVSEEINFDNEKTRKALIKRFSQAKKIAEEKNVPQENVFLDQELYFELVRKSTSPQEIISATKQAIFQFKKVSLPLLRHELRSGLIIANADNESVDIEDIDKITSRKTDSLKFKSEISEALLDFEEYMQKFNHLLIERYWGPKIADLYK